MLINRHLNNALARAPYDPRSALATLVARAMLITKPPALLRGIKKRGKRW